jgi:hypothetical protein
MPNSTTELMPVTVREWTDILARIRFGTVRIAGKGVAGARIKLVAARLANYADSNGTRVRPGIARVAVDLELDARPTRAIVAYLREVGLIELVRASKTTGGADEYRLTLPVDLLDRDDLTVWSPTRHTAEVDRIRAALRRRPKPSPTDPRGPKLPIPEGPVDEPPVPVPQGQVEAPETDTRTGPSGTSNEARTGPSGTPVPVPQGPATYQDLDTTTTFHPDGELRTDVTGPRATGEDPKTPKRCPDHRILLKPRTDRLPPCPLCRAGAPPTPEGLATVISLDSRRVS